MMSKMIVREDDKMDDDIKSEDNVQTDAEKDSNSQNDKEEDKREEKMEVVNNRIEVSDVNNGSVENTKSIENKISNEVTSKNDKMSEEVDSTNERTETDKVTEELKNTQSQNQDGFTFAIPTSLNVDENSSSEKKTQELPYQQPPWGGTPDPDKRYFLTILKDGVIKGNVQLANKNFVTFGRMADCDVPIEHPSCSRYHAVIQYCVVEKDVRKKGYYIFDLNSTHGTYVNKEKIKGKVFTRLRVGYQIKFGGSTRIYIVEGPDDDREDEVDLDVLRKKKQMYLKQQQVNKQKNSMKIANEVSSLQNDHSESGDVTWGFGEDAVEEHINLQELFEKKKSIEIKDPKKSLRSFFENEGIDFEYEMSERGTSYNVIHVAKVRLPIETATSHEVVAEGTGSSKKDAVLACATEACKLIQAYDAIQAKCTEDQRIKRQRELEENDFYDSDEDNFLDRTGSIETKRLQRKKRAGKKGVENKVLTHDNLKDDLLNKENELKQLERKLDLAKQAESMEDNGNLDDYMQLVEHNLDKSSKLKLRKQIADTKKEIERLSKLVEKTKPALPAVQVTSSSVENKLHSNESEEKKIREVNIQPKVASEKDQTSKSEPNNVNTNQQKKKEKTKINMQAVHVVIPEDTATKAPPTKKKKKVYGVQNKQMNKVDDNDDDDISGWMPPVGQTGDGRTHLNEKFGY